MPAARGQMSKELQDSFRQFNLALAFMTVVPLLICLYLITVRFFDVSILVGLDGMYFFLAVVVAVLGLFIGRWVIQRVMRRLIDVNAQAEQLLAELKSTNTRLTEELAQRLRVEEALQRERDELAKMNTGLLALDTQVGQLKKEVNDLSRQLGRDQKYA